MSYTRKTADIITSNDLDYVLEQIKDNSEVARLCLKQRHPIENLVENHINYISISNSDKTKISYLTPERLDVILSRGEDVWTSPRRFHIKPGAFVSKLFKNVSPKETEIFSTLFRNIQSKIDYKFLVVEGRDIPTYYHADSYYNNNGSLGMSCMKYDGCQDYFKIYTRNSEAIKMLIAVNNSGRLIGRALLWTQGDRKIMDRIYTINDEDFQFSFKKWADENGYWYKREQKWNNTLFFKTKDKVLCEEISIQLDKWDFSEYPYLDTFKFLDTKTGRLYNYIPKGVDVRTLSSAEGSYHNREIYGFCEKTKVLYSVDSLCYVPNIGMKVGDDLCVYSNTFDVHILREDAKYDNEVDDWIFQDDDLNNHILLEKRKEDLKKRQSWDKVMEYMADEYVVDDNYIEL